MVDTRRIFADFTKPPRGGRYIWVVIVGGLLPIAYGVLAMISSRPGGPEVFFAGLFVVTLGFAESLPDDWIRAATTLRVLAAVSFLLSLVLMVTTFPT